MALNSDQIFLNKLRLYPQSSAVYTDPRFELTVPALSGSFSWQLPASQPSGSRALIVDSSGAISYANLAGEGLAFTSGQLSAQGTPNRISVTGSGIDIASNYAGQTSITTLGTIAVGDIGLGTSVVTGILPVSKGGTGSSSLSNGSLLIGNGTGSIGTLNPGSAGQAIISTGSAWQSSSLTSDNISDFEEATDDRVAALLSAGNGISLTYSDTANSLTIANTGVTSVSLATPSWLSVSGSPVTGSGTLTIGAAPGQPANQFLATPDGLTGSVALRAIVTEDLPVVTVPKGGTGLSSLTANHLLAGNGIGSVNLISPGSNLNVLASNGSTWQSTALSVDHVSNFYEKVLNKGYVRAATTTALTLTSATATTITNTSGMPTTIDGVTLAVDDLILVKNQTGSGSTGAAANGWYVYSAGNTWNRWVGADTSFKLIPGSSAYVAEGAINAGKVYLLTTPAPITLGSTELTFSQLNEGASSWGNWQTLTLENDWVADTTTFPNRRTNAYRVRGNELEFSLCVANSNASLYVSIATLPVGARPSNIIDVAGLSYGNSISGAALVAIRHDGIILANSLVATNTAVTLSIRAVIQLS